MLQRKISTLYTKYSILLFQRLEYLFNQTLNLIELKLSYQRQLKYQFLILFLKEIFLNLVLYQSKSFDRVYT